MNILDAASNHDTTFIPPHEASSPFLYSAHPDFPSLSFQEVVNASNHATLWLFEQGFSQGSRCAFVAQNTPETVVMLLACLHAGIIAMPLSPRFPEQLVQELVTTAKAGFISLPNVFHSTLASKKQFQCDVRYDATILCSSGSTGLPKMFIHTVESHLLSAIGSQANIPFGQGDCWLAALPFYHVGGYATLFRALACGGAIALPSSASFDVAAFTRSLEQFPITHCSLVATQLHHCLRSEQATERLSRLQAILLGGSAIPERLIEQALERGLRIFTSYGSTEMASQITTTKSPGREELRTSGSILPYREITISNDGEILVRGKTLAKGRLTEQGIAPLVDEHGWYHTNDLGELDARGRLQVRGRRDNMFISGGENIHPEAIEKVLLERGDILQAIVVPVPHEIYGFRPVAFVDCANDRYENPAIQEKFTQHLEAKLPRFMIPTFFFAFPEEMLQHGIKPSRRALQEFAAKHIRSAQ